MISQEVFLEAEASYSTGLAGGFFTLKITTKQGVLTASPVRPVTLFFCVFKLVVFNADSVPFFESEFYQLFDAASV